MGLRDWLSGWAPPSYLRDNGILGMNRRNGDYISRYNSRSRYPLVDNKLLTKEVVEKAKIAAPKLIDVVRAQYEIEHIAPRVENLEQFVVKPANGSGGKGILVITARDGDLFVKSSGVRITLDAYQQFPNVRNRIEHIETIDLIDLPRFAQLGVLASLQPIHADPDTIHVLSLIHI